ncbi:hypothetical protein RHGRI_019342 [Rhododendron griersonianum]|uniref:Uncharacterized protein n=1 Tax=Rhododendron griersonianum TaxID=479676 RepID=A0AAV6JHM1_9ERIC|nr:hypothetical protein RHGRI_019342 [Rhododendron griersonianum]
MAYGIRNRCKVYASHVFDIWLFAISTCLVFLHKMVNFPLVENTYPVEYAFQLFKRKKQSAEFADSMLKLAWAFPKVLRYLQRDKAEDTRPYIVSQSVYSLAWHLIDDMVVYALKSEGCYVWACKNYDGMYRVISCHKGLDLLV